MTDPIGGFLLWVRLGRGDAMALYEAALREGISILPGPLCTVDGGFADCIRLSCGHPLGESHARAFETLGKLAAAT